MCLFLERAISPLQLAQAQVTEQLRYCWIRQLLSTIVQLEELGFTHSDLTVQNIGIDDNDYLKLFDFGSVTRNTHNTFYQALEKDRINLATCLYFLLSGVDLITNTKDLREVRCIQEEMREGRYSIAPEARVLRDIILDGWTGHAPPCTFGKTQKIVEDIIGVGNDDALHSSAPKDYHTMEAASVGWLKTATLKSHWLTEE